MNLCNATTISQCSTSLVQIPTIAPPILFSVSVVFLDMLFSTSYGTWKKEHSYRY